MNVLRAASISGSSWPSKLKWASTLGEAIETEPLGVDRELRLPPRMVAMDRFDMDGGMSLLIERESESDARVVMYMKLTRCGVGRGGVIISVWRSVVVAMRRTYCDLSPGGLSLASS